MSLNKKKGPAPPPGEAARSCGRAIGMPGTAEQSPPASWASAVPLPGAGVAALGPGSGGAGVRAPPMDAPGDPEGPPPPAGDGEQRDPDAPGRLGACLSVELAGFVAETVGKAGTWL